MASLDVDSLFTDIPLEETIDSLYNDDENTPKTPKDLFRNLLNVATKVSFYMFNNKFYKQIDGVTMGSHIYYISVVVKINSSEIALRV